MCGVQIKHLSPSECTEGANLRTAAPMTSAFHSRPRDHGLNLSPCIPSCPRAALSGGLCTGLVASAIQIQMLGGVRSGSLESAWAPGCKRNNCFPEQGRKLQTQQRPNTNSLVTRQKNSLWSSSHSRNITGAKPLLQAEPCRTLSGVFELPHVPYLVLCRSRCRMLLLGDVLS